MTVRILIGDVRDRLADIPDGSIDLVLTSPPFLALRSYLPADHPDKHREIGSEATPGAFLDVLLDVVEAIRPKLAPHGSIAVELGDSYAGSGGSGGDYTNGGMRGGQPAFDGSEARNRNGNPSYRRDRDLTVGRDDTPGWPLAKSLCLIPETFRFALVYGRNPHTGRTTPPWRARNVIRWARPNPPVGALGDKFRPATSDMVIACVGTCRYFDLDAVRVPGVTGDRKMYQSDAHTLRPPNRRGPSDDPRPGVIANNPAGAPPLDWWDPAALIIDQALRDGATDGRAIARVLYNRGLLDDGDTWRIPTQPYKGAHYATWPEALCRTPILAMCPQRVCTTCGTPSERITGEAWTDCGHGTWRHGIVLDPFAGSGTTLKVAVDCGRDAVGIDLDRRNAELIADRLDDPLGLFGLTIDDPADARQ